MNIHALIDQAEAKQREAAECEAKEKAERVKELHLQAVDFIERLKEGTEECTVKPMEVTGDNLDYLTVWIEINVPGLMPFFVCSGKKGLLLTSWGKGQKSPGALSWGQVSALTTNEGQVSQFFHEMKFREDKEAEHRAKRRKQEEDAQYEREISAILRQLNRVHTSPDFITDPGEINRLVDRLILLSPDRKQNWQSIVAKWSEALTQREKWLAEEAREEAERQAHKELYEARKAELEAAYRFYIATRRERVRRNNDAANLLRRVHGDAVLTLVDVVYAMPDPAGGNEWSEKTDVCLFCEQESPFYHVVEPGGKIKKWAYTSIVKTSAPYQVKVRDLGNRAGIVYLGDYGVEDPIRFSPILDTTETGQQIYRAMAQLPEEPDTNGLHPADVYDIYEQVVSEA